MWWHYRYIDVFGTSIWPLCELHMSISSLIVHFHSFLSLFCWIFILNIRDCVEETLVQLETGSNESFSINFSIQINTVWTFWRKLNLRTWINISQYHFPTFTTSCLLGNKVYQRWANNSLFEYLRPNSDIHIRIRKIFSNPIIFVFVFGWFSKPNVFVFVFLFTWFSKPRRIV